MPKKHRALGRGLDALLPGSSPGAAHVAASGGLLEIPVSDIAPSPDQPRRIFNDEEIEKLAASIRRHGVLQPVVVRHAPADMGVPYELVVGERRWRAAQRTGRATLPAAVQDVAEDDLLEVALVENVQRRDLNAMELAEAFRALCDAGLTQEQVGERVGLERSTVANHLRLLELPDALRQDVEDERISPGHAKALLSLDDPELRKQLAQRIKSEGMSVRAAERAVHTLESHSTGTGKKGRKARRDPNREELVKGLETLLQTRVNIVSKDGRSGRIEIHFSGHDDFDRLRKIFQRGGKSS